MDRQGSAELLVFLVPGTNAAAYAKDLGLTVKSRLKSDADAYVLAAGSSEAAMNALTAAENDARTVTAYENRRTMYVKSAFVPNDPYFHKGTPAAEWKGQWHLLNEHVTGRDGRLQGAWNRDVTGNGVTIGIVDDSLQHAHPDLAPNYKPADSWDFGQNDNDPDPVHSDDQHGISVAGVAAARGGNGIGVTGAAPLAGLAGLRIDFENQTTQMFVDGTLYHSSGGNTNIKVKNHSYGISIPYIDSSAEVSAIQTSAAAGTIHCVAAGNEKYNHGFFIDVDSSGDFTEDVDYGLDGDANKKDNQNNPEVICVAAIASDGISSYYSNWGACIFVTAPSNGISGFGVTTTDRMGEPDGYNGASDSFPDGDYTSLFGGTSSASPLAAGIMALLKQVKPTADVRFAKHLLARTSDIVDANDASLSSDGGWKTNGAGFHVNQNYGFGLIDADELTFMATQYAGVTPLVTENTGTIAVGATVPGTPGSISDTFELSGLQPLEEVLIHLNVTHAWRGDIEAYLTSPSGMTSRLMMENVADSWDDINWTFTTNAFWGEMPSGTWTLTLLDTYPAFDTGTWNSYAVTARMGDVIPAVTLPSIATAVSQRTHGGAGDFDIDLLASSAVECRQGGPTKLIVSFDGAIQQVSGTHADVVLSSGSISSLNVAGNTLTVNMSGATNAAILVVAFPGISALGQPATQVTDTLCFGVLAGDLTADRATNIFDLIGIRNTLNQVVTTSNFRNDVTTDGNINIFDLIAIRNNLNKTVVTCP